MNMRKRKIYLTLWYVCVHFRWYLIGVNLRFNLHGSEKAFVMCSDDSLSMLGDPDVDVMSVNAGPLNL